MKHATGYIYSRVFDRDDSERRTNGGAYTYLLTCEHLLIDSSAFIIGARVACLACTHGAHDEPERQSMKIEIELTELDLKRLVLQEIEKQTGLLVAIDNVTIEVKSKQNYSSEWESAAFRARYRKVGE